MLRFSSVKQGNQGSRNILSEKQKSHCEKTLMITNGSGDMLICCSPFLGLCLFLTYSITKHTKLVWRTVVIDIDSSSSCQLQLFHSNCQCLSGRNFSSIDTTLFYGVIVSNL